MAGTWGNNRTYEEYDPKVEWSRDAEAEAAKISLPGFKREDIRVLVDNHGHLRTRGERPITGTRWSRFQKDFQLPANCNVDAIRAKFENEKLTITLPKKTPSPLPAPVTPQAPTPPIPEPPRRPAAAPSVRLPAPLPEPAARPAAPPTVPAAALAPAAPQKPAAERRPSMPTKPTPAPEVVPPKSYAGGDSATTRTPPPLGAVTRPDEEEERKQMEREAAGKMAEDTKAMMQGKEQEGEEALAAEMAMARQPRPVSASRGLLMNVAVAVVLLLGITAYVWHTLRNATGGAGGHGHGHLGAGSYGDEM